MKYVHAKNKRRKIQKITAKVEECNLCIVIVFW